MYIFQANDKVPLSDEMFKKWNDYLCIQNENDYPILLPPFIDFVAAINDNITFIPNEDLISELRETNDNDDEDFEPP